MTWSGFWAPLLVQAVVGGILSTAVGIVAGVLLRRLWRNVIKPQLDATAGHALSGAVSASQAASDASTTRVDTAAVLRRLSGLEGVVEGVRDGISASLGHRAREDLRFRELEQRLEQLRNERSPL